ncbi:Protein N-acetyltransferase, RimJ/RimL family [Pseudomonas sp. NFACC23-1]|uniref:GNAT family N-acetyltransferase n=1 Tax=unclassified Pseudomonas TaxID=196821 RepID=UPI0008848532|nr:MULTISPECIES: GNAT family N-acetyltransferase [unclassified Pseudomonas]SDB07072.1 Protein N-acetyltransferase, RimJ/RimL family [Pseudomonas sp. NFACC17-2]SEI96550.1 Protein N-acetyltransferase, RimJ/RimL family [Pseudomonas sp. NFACC23-1]SFW33458.1 Protein N-acetyltransferase, RimJ/RimL family [Pseudomonas sp. NFACC16-2]
MKLSSKSILLRLIEESDAEFVLTLRLDENYSRHLSSVVSDIEVQRSWIRNYKSDEAAGLQYYFIIERLDGVPCGTVRIYDIRDNSFSWGSWILNEDKTRYAAIESSFLIYQFGFEHLGFTKCHFDVRKENTKVISFHEKMGAYRTGETDLDILFEITPSLVALSKEKLASKLLS